MQKVESIEHLRQLTAGKPQQFALLLNGGAFSRKTIKFTAKKRWSVYNHIDDTRAFYRTDSELAEFTLIPEAIEKNAFVLLDGGK